MSGVLASVTIPGMVTVLLFALRSLVLMVVVGTGVAVVCVVPDMFMVMNVLSVHGAVRVVLFPVSCVALVVFALIVMVRPAGIIVFAVIGGIVNACA